ncbi:MAG: repressor LexA [Candidatus Omnitrophica bacterium]|nr:repressor LexA [Candidatus Omnitrophota bacterium]
MKYVVTEKELQAIREIRNTFVHRGKFPSTRDLMKTLGYRSPRSSALIIERLILKGFLRRRQNGSLQLVKATEGDTTSAKTVNVPLVGTVACGIPILADENIEAMIPVSTDLAKPPAKYFLLRAKGDSMDLSGINDGDIVLVRQQATATAGDSVVALIDDEATIKELHPSPHAIVLKPKSKNRQHKPIVLTKNFRIQGIVVTAIPNL